MNRCIIGIDTGGTFTDGVLLHYSSREVISSAKSLTTRHDLKEGVVKVIKKLNITDEHRIKLVGISSTLATNSVAEGKARKVGLLLVGYDKDLIEKFGLEDNLSTDDISFFKGGHNAQGAEKEPLDIGGIREWIRDKQNDVEAIAVSSYFSPLNPEHEEKAFEIIKEETDLPVVMAHQLSSKLNSIKRAATASINASLVAVMQDFILSVQNSLKELGIDAPLMIVRGDGTLMPYEEAVQKPVETVMSGPAASAIGGRFISGEGSSLVVDMGSTTTDIALVRNSRVVISEEGARVGNTDTAVEAARIRTISVGCDSKLNIDSKRELVIGPHRVRALSQIAVHHKEVRDELYELKNPANTRNNLYDLIYWYYHRPLDDFLFDQLNDKQKKALDFLYEPKSLSWIMQQMDVFHPSHLQLDELFLHGHLESSSLNPSDLLHVKGRMDLWDKEIAEIALKYFCRIYDFNPSEFIDKTFDRIVELIVEEIIIFLAYQNVDVSKMPMSIDGQWGKWMLREILYSDNDYLTIDADSRYPIVGTGAPAKHFLKRAAKIVKTKCVLPEYTEVANAIGAVSGSISETKEAMVFIRESDQQYTYIAKFDGQTKNFEQYDDACDYAEEMARLLAKEAARRAGAFDPFLEVNRKKDGSLTRFIARAIGNPKLSEVRESENVDLV